MRMDGASLLMTAMLPWCAAAAAFHAQPFRSTAAAASHILMQDVDAMENAYIHAEVEAAASEVEVLHAQEEVMPAPMAEAMKEVQAQDRYRAALRATGHDAADRDSAVVQYREAATFFGGLLHSRGDGPSTPIEELVQEKIRQISFLQSELEYVVATGLESTARKQWLLDKADLEARKAECAEDWAELRARQQTTTDAFDRLTAAQADGAAPSATSTTSAALALKTQWTTGSILSRTSLKAQVALIEENVALSTRQMRLDREDEQLMLTVLQLYEQERDSRERRAALLAEQQKLLSELQTLAEDTQAFHGYAAFGGDGFAEGLTY